MKYLKEIKILIFILFLGFGLVAQAATANADLSEFEKSVEERLAGIARVQFGTADDFVFHVRATLKKEPVEETNAVDVGYLSVPVSLNKEKSEENIEAKVQSMDIGIIASSRVPKNSLNQFQANVKKIFAPFRAQVKVQTVDFVKLGETKNDTDEEQKKNQLSLREKIIAGLVIAAILIWGMVFFLSLGMMSRAIRQSGQSLAKALGQLLNMGHKPETPKETPEKPVLPNAQQAPLRPNVNMHLVTEQLRRLCHAEPLAVAKVLNFDEDDQLGLRWLLTQLPSEDQRKLQNFLGAERMQSLVTAKSLSAAGFHLATWAQGFCERITLQMLQGKALIEEALASEDLAFLYRVSGSEALQVAREMRNSAVWRLSLEVIPAEVLSKDGALSVEDWDFIFKSSSASAESIKTQWPMFRNKLEKPLTVAGPKMDFVLVEKLIRPLLSSLQSMSFEKEEQFLQNLAQSQPQVVAEVQKRFWNFNMFKQVDRSALQEFIAQLESEKVTALLLNLTKTDQEFVTEMIPAGMRRTVILDTLKKAEDKNNDNDRTAALKTARQILQSAFLKHQAGQLNLQKVTVPPSPPLQKAG